MDVNIITPWLELHRKGSIENGCSVIVDEIIVKKSFITKEDRQTQQYKDFKEKLQQNYKSPMAIVD